MINGSTEGPQTYFGKKMFRRVSQVRKVSEADGRSRTKTTIDSQLGVALSSNQQFSWGIFEIKLWDEEVYLSLNFLNELSLIEMGTNKEGG